MKAAESQVHSETYNVGSGGSYRINHLVELLGGEVVHIPKRPGEPDVTFADTTKIRNQLSWEPQISFEKGVGIMLDNIGMWSSAPTWDAGSIEIATEQWFKYLSD